MHFFHSQWLGALIGIVILLFGRKLFWLCVAAVAMQHFYKYPRTLLMNRHRSFVALLLGLIGALLAPFSAENRDCRSRFPGGR